MAKKKNYTFAEMYLRTTKESKAKDTEALEAFVKSQKECPLTRAEPTPQFWYALALCANYEIDAELVQRAALDGDPAAISQLALLLTEKVKSRMAARKRPAPTRTQGEIEPALVSWLIAEMVQRYADKSNPLPPQLVALLRAHLKADSFSLTKTKKALQFARAVLYRAVRPTASLTEVARWAGVTIPAVRSWEQQPNFKAAVDELRRNPNAVAFISDSLDLLAIADQTGPLTWRVPE